ncbi:MAG: hypothetical protein LBP27_06840 [Treponema sp.]|nr:hypothetical protein [Treponema sp.]
MNSRKLFARIAENWFAKVLSVFIALLLFVFHRMSTLEDRFLSVPLAVEANALFIPASSYTRIIKVTIRGDANSIYPILEDDIEAYIDLKKYDAGGWYRVPVQVRKKGTALGVEPLEISVDPMEISLQLDQKTSKYVPLTAGLRGNVESGYDFVSYTLTPTQVVIDGPMNVVGAVSELYTDVVDLEGRKEDFSVMVNVLNRDPLIVIRGNGMTEFRGFIRPSVPVRNIDEIPIVFHGLAGSLEGVPDIKTGSVRLEGDQALLDQFVPPPDFLSVDCSPVTGPGEYTLPVTVNLPPGLSLVRREPQRVTLAVSPGDEAP